MVALELGKEFLVFGTWGPTFEEELMFHGRGIGYVCSMWR